MSQRYSKNEVEFIKVRLETCSSYETIARELIRNFDSERDLVSVIKKVGKVDNNLKIKGKGRDIKRLFFDIETSQMVFKGWRTGKQWVGAHQIEQQKKIICISYKWQFEEQVHTLTWDKNMDDHKMIKKFIKILGEAQEIIGHNIDRFDIKELRTRAIKEGLLMFPNYRTLDTLKKARKYFNFESNKLDYLGEIFGVGRKLEHEGKGLWDKVEAGDEKALAKMVEYCEQDVILLEDVFHTMNAYIDHNTNYAGLLGGENYDCPNCASKHVKFHHTDTTPKNFIHKWMKCDGCKKQYRISNKSYIKFITDGAGQGGRWESI